jgi:hypothetical protein
MSDEIAATVATPEAVQVTTSEPAANTPAPSLDDTLREVQAEIKARQPIQGADGRFQPKIAAEGANGTEVPGGPQAAQTPDPAKPVIEAPQSLPADVKAKWDTFPPEAQQWLANREKEIHQKFTTDGERLKSLSGYEEVLAPFQERLKQVGAPATEYIRRLAEADKLLASDPTRGILEVARMYGINLGQLQHPGAQPDPNSALSREISDLKSQLNSLTTESERAKVSAAQQIINDAKKDMPHYDAVEPLMVKLYEPGMDLKALYAMAVKAHPDVGAKIEAEAKAAADKKAADEAKEKAAKDAKITPFAKKPGATPAGKKGDIWDTLKETHAEIRARG